MSAKELIKYYGQHYRENVGEQYPPSWGRDTKIFNSLLKLYPVEILKVLIDYYFSEKRTVYAIPFFKTQLSELIQLHKQSQVTNPPRIEDNESWRYDQ